VSIVDTMLIHPTQAELIAATEANYAAYFKGFGCLPRCEFHSDTEITWFIADGPPGDSVLHTQFPPEQARQKIDAALTMLKARAEGGWWQVLPSCQPPDLASQLQTRGLVKTESRPVMTVDLAMLKDAASMPTNLRIEKVKDLTTLHDWFVASVAGFEATTEVEQVYFDAYAALGFAKDAAFHHYVGYLNGEPVTSSTLLLAAGLAGIYDVSTAPAARRQGFGRAITLVPLLEARSRGYRYAVLQSSEEGYSMYRSIGFETLYTEENYLWKRQS
jgi:ribosomal protein S18 acetylase RimI-like enzyme